MHDLALVRKSIVFLFILFFAQSASAQCIYGAGYQADLLRSAGSWSFTWNGTLVAIGSNDTVVVGGMRYTKGAYISTYDIGWGGATDIYQICRTVANTTPTISNINVGMNEDTIGRFNLYATDPDAGDWHTFTLVSGPNPAAASMWLEGSQLVVAPHLNWFGDMTISYRATDSKGAQSNIATIRVSVYNVNDPPVAPNRVMTLDEDTPSSLALYATDIDSPAPTVFQIVSPPNGAHGTAWISGTTLTFTPSSNWNGTTSLTYRAMDNAGAWSAPATVTITVRPVNDPPSVTNVSLTTDEDRAGTISLPVTDPDLQFEGDSHTWHIVTPPNASFGSASINGNQLTFTPSPNWNGTTSMTYRAQDSRGAISNTATVTTVVRPVNDPPSVTNLSHAMNEDTVAVLTLPVTDVDLQFEGDSHTWHIVSPPHSTHATASIAGNKLTFTPRPNWNGTATLTYLARDSHGADSNIGTVTITVRPVNDLPSVTDLTHSMDEDTVAAITLPVTDVDLQFEGDSHTWHIVTPPNAAHASASINGNQLTFTPTKDWFGVSTLTYKARDSHGAESNVGKIIVTVINVNDPPVVQPVDLTTKEDTELRYRLSATDIDSNPPFTFQTLGNLDVRHGVIGIEGDILVFMPTQDWSGVIELQYRASDDDGDWSEPKPLKITVTPVNDAPPATGAKISALENQQPDPVTPWVIDPDIPYGDSHIFTVVSQPANGSVAMENNQLVFTPNQQYVGTDSFSIRATDRAGLWVEGKVDVEVARYNYAPTDILPGTVSMFEGVGGSATLYVSDVNLWDDHTFEVVTQPEHGVVTISGQAITYRTDSASDALVRIRATDQGGLSIEKNINLSMRPAWEMIAGRDVIALDSDVKLPAIQAQLHDSKGNYPLAITDAALLELLDDDIVLVVEPDSTVGAQVEHRGLKPGEGMRLIPHKHTASLIESKVGALNPAVAGTATLFFSRADMTGPVISLPVSMWTLNGQLTSTQGWEVLQGVTQTRIAFEPSAAACTVNTHEATVKPKNLLEDPHCFVQWGAVLDESRTSSTPNRLQMDTIGKTVGAQNAVAQAFVYDNNGNKHAIGTIERELTVVPPSDKVMMNLEPAPETVYQAVQDLTMVLRASGDSMACDITNSETQARRQSANWNMRPSCLVTWTGVPLGLETTQTWSTPQLRGSIKELNEQTISWSVSVFTPGGSKVLISEQSHTINVIVPPPIEVDLPNTPTRLSESMYSAPSSGGFVGSAVIAAVPSDIHMLVKSGLDTVRDEVVTNYGRAMRITSPITAPAAPLWTVTPFSLQASYAQLPSVVTKTDIELLSVPGDTVLPILLNDERIVLDTDEFVVSAKIVDTRHLQDGYSSLKHGDWDIRLVRSVPGGKYEPMTDWSAIDADGVANFPLDLVDMTNQVMRVFAEARVRSPVSEYSSHRRSTSPLALSVLNGNPLDSKITTLRLVGLAPLRTTFIVSTVDNWESRDIGEVNWEISTDNGATWEAHKHTGNIQQRFSNVFDKGTYLVRAHVFNRHSGARSITPTVEVIAFEVPQARLEGPRNVFIGDEAVYNITDPAGNPLNTDGIQIEWSQDRGATWTTGGRSYRISNDAGNRIYLQARLKYEDAPDHRLAYRNLRTGVAFRAVRPPRVQIIGPRRPEVGKEATWFANMMMPYPNMNLKMDGFFILPDGEVNLSREVKYTPTQEDFDRERSYITFDGWIKGFEEKGGRGLTEHRLLFWSYDWPEWRFQVKASAIYAPADVTFTLRNLGIFKEFESLQVDWELPEGEGIEVTRDTSTMSRSFTITAPGTYMVAAHVTDGRGNYSYVETEISAYEPPEWGVDLLWSGDNPYNRAPMKVLVRPKYYGGHPKDRIEVKQYFLNGEPLPSSGDYGRATLGAGTHDVTMKISTAMGHEATGLTTITVVQNIDPTCDIEVTEGRTSWMAKASCTDDDGRVVGYKWWVNGELQSLSSSAISVPMWRYPEGEPIITVVGVDDSGGESPPVAQK